MFIKKESDNYVFHPSIIGIEISTNNIFDANSLPLSLILKNNAKSAKWYIT